jgi:hypothetical protein
MMSGGSSSRSWNFMKDRSLRRITDRLNRGQSRDRVWRALKATAVRSVLVMAVGEVPGTRPSVLPKLLTESFFCRLYLPPKLR